MKRSLFSLLILSLLLGTQAQAGNPDRIGEAGATHLLINPWARSSGWAGAFTAGVSGLEAMRFNVAGMVRSENNEVVFSRTNWFQGADININSFGIKTKLSEDAAISATIMSFDMGDFYTTTEDFPDGTLGTFSPNYTNIGVGFAYAFSEFTSGGIVVRLVSESIADMNASGVAIDAGIQYRSGEQNRFKLGFALRNIGPAMQYSGNGIDFRATEDGVLNPTARTLKSRVAPFELPSILNIGMGYDVVIMPNGSRFTLAGNFLSNSFGRDNIMLGGEYSYKNILMLRGGFSYEQDILSEADASSVASGPSAGATFQLPYGDAKNFGIDYSFRSTFNKYSGIHSLGVKLEF